MFLCQLDGKLYNGEIPPHYIVLKNDIKELECQCCSQCWALLNTKYELGDNNSMFKIPKEEVITIHKLTKSKFEFKDSSNPESKTIIDILKTMKNNINQKQKKLL